MVGGSKVQGSNVEDAKKHSLEEEILKSEDKQRTPQDVFFQIQDMLIIY